MTEELLGLVLAYVFFTALLLLAVIRGSLKWPIKFVLVFGAVLFYAASYFGWQQSQGWPSRAQLPQKFLFHYAVIEEPDKERSEEGKIFIWLTDLNNHEMADKPRAYQMPYERGMHGELEQALKKMRSGQPQLGEFKPEVKQPKQAKNKHALGQKDQPLKFSDVPDPALPEK
ncbi:hypothetical protein [Neptuniibacter sp.]|uniref:hypothetical protein n=1 Tax=Neptuniibacter sp. TaxID=1962643 RepID=UPI0026282757|nr:hypothetical protein [Neptuniibacter sp.]MCP4595234.1 hypothetical protein [Neptuniibacter sp.]